VTTVVGIDPISLKKVRQLWIHGVSGGPKRTGGPAQIGTG